MGATLLKVQEGFCSWSRTVSNLEEQTSWEQIWKIDKNLRKANFSHIRNLMHCWQECNVVQLLRDSMTVPQKVKHQVTIWPSDFHSPKKWEGMSTQSCQHEWMSLVTLFTTAKRWTWPKCPSRMYKQNVAFPHHVLSFGHNKESKTARSSNVHEL